MNDTHLTEHLKSISLDYREKIIRMSHEHTFEIHLGGSLSLSEIFTTLYFHVLNIDPSNPDWPERDRFVLSKGHANIGLLTILSMKGFFSNNELDHFNSLGSIFSMHADARVPGVEHSSGSLGHGLSIAVGMAMIGKRENLPWKVFCIIGDGESMEGSIWEAFMSAYHYRLDNLTVIYDRNMLSQEGETEQIMQLEPLMKKFESFGWFTIDVNGHEIPELLGAFRLKKDNKPKIIIARTKKGYGVPTLEGKVKSHFAHLSKGDVTAALNVIKKERE